MYTRVLGLTTSALILAFGAVGAIAQDQMTLQPDQQQAQFHPMGHEGAGTMEHDERYDGPRHDGWGRDGAPDYVAHDVRSDGRRWRRDDLIDGVPGGSRANFQGNGQQQRWTADP